MKTIEIVESAKHLPVDDDLLDALEMLDDVEDEHFAETDDCTCPTGDLPMQDGRLMTYETLPELVKRQLDDEQQSLWLQVRNAAVNGGDDDDTAARRAWADVLRAREEDEAAERRAFVGYDPRVRMARLLHRLTEHNGGDWRRSLDFIKSHHPELSEQVARAWREGR